LITLEICAYSEKNFNNLLTAVVFILIFLKVLIDFKDENLVRTLSETLLEDDFDVRVSIPKNYLVPRIPQRLNYVLVLEDLLALNGLTQDVVGFDIGE
jgi:methyltransferase